MCSVPGCVNEYSRTGLCASHYVAARPNHPDGYIDRMKVFGQVCWICGDTIADGDLHVDHVIPLAKGGLNVLANLRPTHAACNKSKSDRWPVDTSTAHLRLDPARLP